MAVSVKTYSLWTLTGVKRYLDNSSDTSQDDRLRGIINAVTDRFEMFAQRHLGWHDFTSAGEIYTGDNNTVLYLRGWPIRSLDSVAIEDESAIDTGNDKVVRFAKDDAWEGGKLTLVGGRVWSRGVYPRNVTVKYICGYKPVDDALSGNSVPEDVHLVGHTEIARRFYERDRVREGISSRSFEGESVVYDAPGTLLKETREVLAAYRGWPTQ
ncbi:MAG: hypothetical protein ACE5FA_01755 [Dehalococcoidia bacterium]